MKISLMFLRKEGFNLQPVEADRRNNPNAFIIMRERSCAGVFAGVYVEPDNAGVFLKSFINAISEEGVKMLQHRNAELHEEVLVSTVESHFHPLTSRSFAKKLIPILPTFTEPEYNELFAALGRSSKRSRMQMDRALLICSQYPKWVTEELSYEEAAACCAQWFRIKPGTLRRYITRDLGLPQLRSGAAIVDIFKAGDILK